MTDDILDRLQRNRADLERVLDERYEAITAAREEGVTWARIGEALGMRMQSAHRWYNNTPQNRRGMR